MLALFHVKQNDRGINAEYTILEIITAWLESI